MNERTIAAPQKPLDNSSSSGSRTTEAILAERGSTHGDFTANAHIMQLLKITLRNHSGWEDLSLDKKEGLEMIAHKIGRILCGNPDFRDHWDDIAGYAKLCADRCR